MAQTVRPLDIEDQLDHDESADARPNEVETAIASRTADIETELAKIPD